MLLRMQITIRHQILSFFSAFLRPQSERSDEWDFIERSYQKLAFEIPLKALARSRTQTWWKLSCLQFSWYLGVVGK